MKAMFRSVWVLLLVMLVAGCPAPGLRPSGGKPEQPCAGNGNSRDCWIDVTVREAESGTRRYCTVDIPDAQEDIEFGETDGVRTIVWRLVEAPPNYKFRLDGIVVNGDKDNECKGSDLDEFHRSGRGKRYSVRNRNETASCYPYEIWVFNVNSGLQCGLDPYIRNVR